MSKIPSARQDNITQERFAVSWIGSCRLNTSKKRSALVELVGFESGGAAIPAVGLLSAGPERQGGSSSGPEIELAGHFGMANMRQDAGISRERQRKERDYVREHRRGDSASEMRYEGAG